MMNEVCRLFGVEKLRTTPYKPSTNQVERFHRTLNSILAKTVSEHQKDWDMQLPFALAAYRATRHRYTGYMPNVLVLGRETRAPPDLLYRTPEDEHLEDSFVEGIRTRMTTAYEEVCKQLRKSAEYNERHYNIGLREKKFHARQWVWYYNARRRQMKWVRQCEGKYLILKMLLPLTAKGAFTLRAVRRCAARHQTAKSKRERLEQQNRRRTARCCSHYARRTA